MTTLLDAAPVVGVQRPRIDVAPPAPSSAGEDAVELARRAGLFLDPWQQYVLDRTLAGRYLEHDDHRGDDDDRCYDARCRHEGGHHPGTRGARRRCTVRGCECVAYDDGWRWAAFEAGLVIGRQNGKNGLVEARQLAGLYEFGEKEQTHTAHLFPTALKAFERVLELIQRTPELEVKLRKVSRSHGEEGITLKNGNTLQFRTRTGSAGRGFSGDTVYFDEAMLILPGSLASLLPTLSARRNPQLWYLASPPDELDHATCHALGALHDRAVAGGDPSLCYLEWSAAYEKPDDVAHLCSVQRTPRGDPELEAAIEAATPALGIRLSRDQIENERRSLPPRVFAVERLGVGAWPSTAPDASPVTTEEWAALLEETSQPGASVAFGVETAPDRSHTRIAVASRRLDGHLHVEVVEAREGTGWVVGRLVELVERWDPGAVVMDGRSGAMSFQAELLEHEIEPDVTTARDMATATGEVLDAIRNDRLRHIGQPDLDGAVTTSSLRPLAEAQAWVRSATSTSLIAVTLAAWGVTHRPDSGPPPAPLAVPAERAGELAPTADLMTVGF